MPASDRGLTDEDRFVFTSLWGTTGVGKRSFNDRRAPDAPSLRHKTGAVGGVVAIPSRYPCLEAVTVATRAEPLSAATGR